MRVLRTSRSSLQTLLDNPVKAVRSVLPSHTKLFAVGGISASTIPDWTTVDGFGVGSSICKPADSIETIRQKATLLVEASRQWQQTQENV